MANLREFWDEMEDGDEAECGDRIAHKRGIHLYWKLSDLNVSADDIINGNWTLVKPKPTEIETERWMRCDNNEDSQFLYQDPVFFSKSNKSVIESTKNFLHWGGEDLPYGGRWPRNSQMIWIDFANKSWASCYNKEVGHTEQLVAGWAAMKKEG